MNVKNIITKVCNGQYENVDKLLKNEIAKIQEMRLFAKIVAFVKEFAYTMKDHQGKKLFFEFGYEANCFPQYTALFYALDTKPTLTINQRFHIETGRELLSLLEFAKGSASGSLVIDHALEERMLLLILGEELLQKYIETSFEMRY